MEAPRDEVFNALAAGDHVGWQLVQHASGKPCFVHLKSRVCTWTQPYSVPTEQVLETHEPPAQLARALLPEAKRARTEDPHPNRRKPSGPEPPEGGASTSSAAPSNAVGVPAVYEQIDVAGKTPTEILNEFCPKVLKCTPEFIVTTQEDPVNPYLTTIICEGIIVARAAYLNKKMSRQVAARKALSVLAPLLAIASSEFDEGTGKVCDLGDGTVGALKATREGLEAHEEGVHNLLMSDDRILENAVGKTPVMVLQEHCHKHVGRVPTWTDVITPGSSKALPLYKVTL